MTPSGGEADFAHVFEAMALAVSDAQERLDAAAPQMAVHYTIPRTETDMHFRVRLDEKRKALLIFRLEGKSSHTTNRLRFSILAVPNRPAPPPAALPPVEIAIPPYLLPAKQEQEIGEQTEQFARGQAGAPPGDDTGLVCFRLMDPIRYFVARVDSNHKKDTIYYFYPDVPQRSTFPRDPDKHSRAYFPFGELFAALRAAQRDASLAIYPYTPESDLDWGWDTFDKIARDLWLSYRSAMETLAARAPTGDQPVFFQIDRIRGHFFYSEWTSKSPDQKIDNVFDAEDDWIHNLVVLRHDSTLPASRIELRHAEFVVAGDARRRLLDMIAAPDVSEKIARECQKLAPGVPVAATEFRTAPADVLILLSYEERPPDKGFLAIWPATAGEFLFTFDSDGVTAKDAKGRAFISAAASDHITINDDAYEEIHNFFRAVRLWRSRIPRTSD